MLALGHGIWGLLILITISIKPPTFNCQFKFNRINNQHQQTDKYANQLHHHGITHNSPLEKSFL